MDFHSGLGGNKRGEGGFRVSGEVDSVVGALCIIAALSLSCHKVI